MRVLPEIQPTVAALLLMFVSSAVLTARNVRVLTEDTHRVVASYETTAVLADLLSAMQDAETGQRGFLLVGDPTYLDPYDRAVARVDTRLADLRARIEAGDPSRLDGLARQIAGKRSELDETIALRRAGDLPAALAAVASHRGKREMDAIRSELGSLAAEIEDRRGALVTELHQSFRIALVSGIGTGAGGILLTFGVAWLLRRERRIHEALVQERSWLRTTLTSIGDGVVVTDPAGRVTLMNPVAERLTGWTGAEAEGRLLDEVFRLVPEGSLLVARTGGEVPIEHSASPIRDETSGSNGVVLVFRDVTEKRRSEDELRRSASILDTIGQEGGTAVYIEDLEGRMVYASPRTLQTLEKPAERVLGRTMAEWHDVPDEVAEILKVDRRVLESGEAALIEERLTGSSGTRTFLTRKAPYRDAKGALVGLVGVSTDITELKRAEANLHERERELQTLVDNTPDVVSRFDRDARILFTSRAIETATGRRPADVVGRTNRELGMPDEIGDRWDAELQAVFETGRPGAIEFTYPSPDQTVRAYAGRLIPEFDPSGRVATVLAVMRDRTVEHAAEQALRAADRQKDQFLATLAHELRNPLAPIRTGLEILRRTSNGNATGERTRQMMARQLDHMVHLVDDLLEVSRISTGKIRLRRERVGIGAVVAAAMEASSALIEARRHEVTVDLPVDGAGMLFADPTRLTQVVTNLLNNAAKYTAPGGRIALTVERDANWLVLRVRDSGSGIEPEMLPRVFDLFTQAGRTLESAQGGLGIGLSLVKRLVELHGGAVRAESAGIGHGSTFSVRLPLLAPAPGPEPTVGAAAVNEPSRGRRVLVVDDHVDGAETFAEMLNLIGHETCTAHDGPTALEVAGSFRPEVVFLDIGLPGMSGYDVARRLRGRDDLAPLLLVAMTGWGSDDDKESAYAAGFDLHLTKPLDPAVVRAMFEARSARLRTDAPSNPEQEA